MQCLRSSL